MGDKEPGSQNKFSCRRGCDDIMMRNWDPISWRGNPDGLWERDTQCGNCCLQPWWEHPFLFSYQNKDLSLTFLFSVLCMRGVFFVSISAIYQTRCEVFENYLDPVSLEPRVFNTWGPLSQSLKARIFDTLVLCSHYMRGPLKWRWFVIIKSTVLKIGINRRLIAGGAHPTRSN